MTIANRTKRRLRLFTIMTVMSVMISPVFVYIVGFDYAVNPAVYYHSTFAGLISSALFWSYLLFFLPSTRGAPLRRTRFHVNILVNSFFIAFGLALAFYAEAALLHGRLNPLDIFDQTFLKILGLVFLFVTVLLAIVRIVHMVGGRVLFNIIIGRYHRPLREQRVFMFLDIADSTALAQRLGDIGVHNLICRFFFDITDPILDSEGEIHRYIGDQVVVTWPLREGAANLRSVRCYFAIADLMRAKADHYQRHFGVVPGFRAGLHGGPVVTAQCGDYKQEIVYYGDTVNTAARIQQQCKAFDCSLLVSDELLALITPGDEFKPRSLGPVRLRGRKQESELFTIDRGNAR